MTLATRTATDTLQQTLPWGTHERLVFGRALLRSTCLLYTSDAADE